MAGREAQQLPMKEAGLFRQVVKFYESKQYKKGLKAADQILKKHPDHGETLAMKGLILSYQDKKEEAYDYVRRGLRANLKSHVCWHVYGLVWRADNNYDEAIKCYKNALRIDKDNLQILRDLALLQIQMRDYTGFIETRKALLHLKASNRNNWISFAIAHHLNKDYDLAVQILNGFESTQEDIPKGEEYEHSEMLLYKVMILEEGDQFQEALAQLEQSKQHLKDMLGYEEMRGRLLLKLGKQGEAEATYRYLMGQNPDNVKYHSGLRQSLHLSTDLSVNQGEEEHPQEQQLRELYEKLSKEYPRSSAARRIPLDFLVGPAFEEALQAYVQKYLIKGIPSLFSDLKGLYRSPSKAAVIEKVFQQTLSGLEKEPSTYPRSHASDKREAAGDALLWTRVFLARHYDILGQTDRALELVGECLQQQSEEIEVYGVKSKILKHAGDLEGAAAAAVKAQSLDLADRYLNSVATKALFRAGHVDRAERLAALFTKDSDQPNLLYEMQCMWYEIECGSAYLRKRDYGRALKNFIAVTKHFSTFQEDQFDFHSYCIRKMTLRAYVSMLRMEDGILQNIYYAKAAWGAVQTYLELADAPAQEQKSIQQEEAMLANMSLEDQKKHKQKKKKEAQRKAKEEEKKIQEAEAIALKEKEAAKARGKKVPEKEKDPDPDGVQLASTAHPLVEAAKLLQGLREHASNHLQTHLLGFEVATRRGKQLLALQAVKRAVAVGGPSHPEVHRIIVRFCHQFLGPSSDRQNGFSKENAQPAASVVEEVISSQVGQLLAGQSLNAYHEAFCKDQGRASLAHQAAATEMTALLHPEQREAAVSMLLNGRQGTAELSQANYKDCIDVHKVLKNRLASPKAAQQWAASCRDTFPRVAYFDGPKTTPLSELESVYDLQNGTKSTQKQK